MWPLGRPTRSLLAAGSGEHTCPFRPATIQGSRLPTCPQARPLPRCRQWLPTSSTSRPAGLAGLEGGRRRGWRGTWPRWRPPRNLLVSRRTTHDPTVRLSFPAQRWNSFDLSPLSSSNILACTGRERTSSSDFVVLDGRDSRCGRIRSARVPVCVTVDQKPSGGRRPHAGDFPPGVAPPRSAASVASNTCVALLNCHEFVERLAPPRKTPAAIG